MFRLRITITQYACFVFFCLLFFSVSTLSARELVPPTLREVGVSENIGRSISLDLSFLNEKNERVLLSDYFGEEKAVIINLAYYSCPMLCHLVAQGLVTALKELPFQIGTRYDVLSVSIDPQDTVDNAAAFEKKYATQFNDDTATSYWHFLTGNPGAIETLTSDLGFRYRYNEKTKQFAHSAAIVILTPDGNISRYLYGIQYDPFDMKMGIIEAQNRRTISSIERVLLFCYNYDPQTRKYVVYAYGVMRIGGGVTLFLIVLSFLYYMKIKKRK